MLRAAILGVFIQELALPEIKISAQNLRERFLVGYLMKHGAFSLAREMPIRARSVWQLGRTCYFNEAHACTTARLALALFDSARNAGLHHLGDWERELLEYTAVLHHIGAFLRHTDYQAHTYYLIQHANLLGFDQTEIVIMATTALFHRKALPRKRHPAFAALDQRARQIVRILSVLLRLAENLDRGYAGLILDARLYVVDMQHVVLHIDVAYNCQVEVWGVQKHRAAFEKVFGQHLVIRVRR